MEERQTRTLTWMAAVLVGLVAVVVFIEPDEDADEDNPTTDPFPDLKAEDIHALSLTLAEGTTAELTRGEDGSWSFAAPSQARADAQSVDAAPRRAGEPRVQRGPRR